MQPTEKNTHGCTVSSIHKSFSHSEFARLPWGSVPSNTPCNPQKHGEARWSPKCCRAQSQQAHHIECQKNPISFHLLSPIPISSYLLPSPPISSHLSSSHLISSLLFSSHLILSHLISSPPMSHPISSHFVPPRLTSPHLISPRLISSNLISCHLISSLLSLLSLLPLSLSLLSHLLLSLISPLSLLFLLSVLSLISWAVVWGVNWGVFGTTNMHAHIHMWKLPRNLWVMDAPLDTARGLLSRFFASVDQRRRGRCQQSRLTAIRIGATGRRNRSLLIFFYPHCRMIKITKGGY